MTLDERLAVIEEAKTWIGTPYHHQARVKGSCGGVDCLTLLAEVYERAGIIDRADPGNYSEQWMLNRDEEKYIDGLLEYCIEVQMPDMADIAVWRIGRTYSHGAIVLSWPHLVIHAYLPERFVVYGDPSKGDLAERKVRFFSPRGRK